MDKKKIIKGLNQHCNGSMFDRCDECPYYEFTKEPFKCRDELLEDVFTLLKEPEAIESIDFGDKTEIMANLEGLTWDDWRMYHSDTEVQNIAKSAFDLLIELLREQEAAEPISFMDGIVERFACKKCGKHLLMTSWGRDNYCSKCGQKVKWND